MTIELNHEKTGLLAFTAVEKSQYAFDLLFCYLVPEEFSEEAEIGKRIVIPFGNGSKKCIGMIMELKTDKYNPLKIKTVIEIVDKEAVLNHEMIKIALWMKESAFCTYFDAVKAIIPPGLSLDLKEQYKINKEIKQYSLNRYEIDIYNLLISTKTARETDDLVKSLIKEKKELFDSLVSKNIITKIHETKQKVGSESLRMLKLASSENELAGINLTPKQKKVVDFLIENGSASIKEICYTCNTTTAVTAGLIKKGVVSEYQYEILRQAVKKAENNKGINDLILSPSQNEVFCGLSKLFNSNEPKCALLRGITGSGKTSIFIKLIDNVLLENKTAIMLVPEIALTPQMLGNFIKAFGNKVAVIHSALSLGQRADEYKRIKNGNASIVIGTRSAIFAPLRNIGVIIIDEEGEHTYKSERNPRYHARNVAKQRTFYNKSLLLLASATPSLESYYKAVSGVYSLFELDERYKDAVLPDVFIVDMKIEALKGNRSNFSGILINELKKNLESGEQSLILLNRRGYHTYISCISCGEVVVCPACGIALTYHKTNESVICHYCGYTKPMSDKCIKCGSKYIHQSGTGTQRIEDELNAYFPSTRILRMDADTTMTKDAYEKKFTEFGTGEYDIMIGTQMIAKGLDFENVTLVGILMIDKLLYAGEYLGYEKTFSLLTQMAGRSGRGSKTGRAYLQTFSPEHYVFGLAASQNYKEFFRQEIEVRKALIFPPFCDLFMVSFSSAVEKRAEDSARCFAKIFLNFIGNSERKLPFVVLGPTKNRIEKINGKFKYKLIIKGKDNSEFRKMIDKTLKTAYNMKEFKNIGISVDINGEI